MSESNGVTPRRLLLIALIGSASIALLLGLAGGQAALAAIGNATWGFLGLAVLVHYGSFALRGHRWQQLLGALGFHLPYAYTTSLLLAGWFTSALLPARAGDLLRVGVLRLDGERHPPVPVAASLSSIVLERVLDILAILALGAGFGFVLLRDQVPPWLLGSYVGGLALLLAFGVALLVAPAVLGALRRLWSHRFYQMALNFVDRFVEGLRTLFRRPDTAVLVSVESLFIWLCDALVLWLVALSLAAPLGPAAAAFVALTVDVLAAVPLTPGGVGQIDAAYAALLALLALPATQVGTVVLLVRLITYWSFLAFSGLITLVAGFGSLLPAALATGAQGAGTQAAGTQAAGTQAAAASAVPSAAGLGGEPAVAETQTTTL